MSTLGFDYRGQRSTESAVADTLPIRPQRL
jgi:hypothetical protein